MTVRAATPREPPVPRRRVAFIGLVQGVGFRATAADTARSYPPPTLTGWVRNEADGSVTLEAQGSAATLDRFLAAVRLRMGRCIRGEQSTEIAEQADEGGFSIRR